MKQRAKILLIFIAVAAIDFFYGGGGEGIVLASFLGALVTGAGVPTVFAGRSQLEQFILIGDVDTTMPLRGISIEIDGNTFINIQASQPLLAAFAKWQNEVAGAVVGVRLRVSTGQIKGNTTYTFVNDGVTTPNIYASSEAQNGIPFLCTTLSINPNSFNDFSKFSALFIANPADVSSVEVVYQNGHKATLDILEVDANFVYNNQAEANGRLSAVSVIDNTNQQIKTVRIYSGANPVVVAIAKLPNAAFEKLNG